MARTASVNVCHVPVRSGRLRRQVCRRRMYRVQIALEGQYFFREALVNQEMGQLQQHVVGQVQDDALVTGDGPLQLSVQAGDAPRVAQVGVDRLALGQHVLSGNRRQRP